MAVLIYGQMKSR